MESTSYVFSFRMVFFYFVNTSRPPSEHPPVRGKYVKTFRWDHRLQRFHGIKTGSPIAVTLGQQYNVGAKPTVILYTYIDSHAETKLKNKTM